MRSNPQLLYTILVALLIALSFIYVAERFTGIANDAQERLINVRIGSIQDAFVSFAKDRMNDPAYLNERIADVANSNETIRSFQVIREEGGVLRTVASNNPLEIGGEVGGLAFLYNIAVTDRAHSITVAREENGERLFDTARAITGPEGVVLGATVSTQTLSLADQMIEKNIRNSRVVLLFILLIVMLLFLRLSRIIDYIDLYKKLKSVDQLKDDFISMASHELRTPLSTIRGYAEFIREAPELTAATRDYSTKIDVSAKDLDILIADILDVSRIEQGRLTFNMEKLDPSVIVGEVVDSLSRNAAEKGLTLTFDRAGERENQKENQYISADKARLRQVLVNLVGNAVKYTSKGEVTVKQSEESGRVRIEIADTGIGMSEEERAKLFEKFYRIRNQDTERIRGTGLGLWITKQIIEEMKGKISVESIKGVGSHFIVTFPITSPDVKSGSRP